MKWFALGLLLLSLLSAMGGSKLFEMMRPAEGGFILSFICYAVAAITGIAGFIIFAVLGFATS